MRIMEDKRRTLSEPNAVHNTLQPEGNIAGISRSYTYDATVDPASRERRSKALLEAAETGATPRVRNLLTSGADVHYCKPTGETALWLAATRGTDECVRLLVDAGSNTNARAGDYNDPPLHRAAAGGWQDAVRTLLQARGIDKDGTSDLGWTALHCAAYGDNAAVIVILAKHGCSVNVVASKQGTPLHVAAWYHNLLAVKALVQSGADVVATNKEGCTPVQWARRSDWNQSFEDDRELVIDFLQSVEKSRKSKKKWWSF